MTRLEARRLEALERLRILDTAAEPEFDQLVQLAASLTGAPIASITFLDERRQWFKASVGLELRENPLDVAFCAWTVRTEDAFVVEDARRDDRFAANPLVVGGPRLRAYAGVPILSREGVPIGAFALMDQAPRAASRDDLAILRALARQASLLLELRLSLQRIGQGEAAALLAQAELEAEAEAREQLLGTATRRLSRLEGLYRALWETTSDAVLILDVESVIQYANPGAVRMFERPLDALRGQPLDVVQPERLRHGHRRGMRDYLATGQRRVDWRAAEAIALRGGGEEFPVEISFSELELDGRRLFVGFLRDITERKRAVAELRRERERATGTLRCIGDGVITLDSGGRVLSINPMGERIAGLGESEAVGKPCDEVLRLVHADGETPVALQLLPATLHGDGTAALPAGALLRAQSGALVPVEGSVAPLACVEGQDDGWVIALRDVSHAHALASQVAFQATHDALTGLINRSEFDRRLRRALVAACERGEHTSLLYLDLDQFKIVNDTCGHVAGGELLKHLASVLQTSLRSSDTLARLGGDEFGVLLEGCPEDRALQIAEKLRDAIDAFTFVWQDQMFTTGVSIGHVHFHDGSMHANEVLSKADEACYVAKDLGRNRIHTYSPDEEAQARRHGEMQWVGLLRQALDEDRFVLHAQPVFHVDRANGAPAHYEVLLRLRGGDGGLIAPMAFIPAAERYGLMPRIDRWVLRHTLALLADPSRGGDASTFVVNLSGATLGDPQFADYVQREIQASGLPASRIGFEITETAAVANFSAAVRLIQQVKALGCSFALDDFGSGLSSFAYLKHLPVDVLKIDGSFVRGIATDPIDRAMVASIHEIGHLMGLRTTAEFVENEAILDELRAIGVDFAQGFGLGRPVPMAQCLPGIAEA